MSITVGKSVARVDAFDKVTGRTKYYEDRMPAGALYIRIKHAEIAHGFVKSVDTAAAEAIDGVVKVLTCFDAVSYTHLPQWGPGRQRRHPQPRGRPHFVRDRRSGADGH